MAETQTQKKNKKSKKKSNSTPIPAVGTAAKSNISSSSNTPNNISIKNSNPKSESKSTLNSAVESVSRNNSLGASNTPKNAGKNISTPKQLLNIKTPENIEVTCVQNGKPPHVTNEVSNKKKKKSKKKSKEEPKAMEEPKVAENDKPNQSLLNFSENGIHLVNHPEISVTFTNVAVPPQVNETDIAKEKSPPAEEVKTENDGDTNSSKKKKKKNKKKGNNSNNVPPEVPATTNENTGTIVTPTYTKVVTADNTCVLVVNNENLAAASKVYGNMEDKSKPSESKVHFSMPSVKTGDVLIKKLSPDTNIQLGNAVSIFPVLTNVNENTSEKNMFSQPSLETVSNILKKDAADSPETENTENLAQTKAELKAERRAKQEAQRAVKAAAKSNAKPDFESVAQNKTAKPAKETSSPKKSNNSTTEAVAEKMSKSNAVSEKKNLRKVRLFSHLQQWKQLDINAEVHPAILEVGSQYHKGIICGSNARCIALLAALREVIEDYIPQPNKKFCRELESCIQTYLSYLNNCRPLSVSMVNAVKFLKHQINHMPPDMEDDKAKEVLCKFIDDFVSEEILLAKKAIGYSASAKIVNGDVILVFSHSSLVKDVLCKAHNKNKIFRVVVADSRPKLEGLQMLRCLVQQGLHCSYISINAVSYVMKEVSKVVIGAHALLSNGCVMSRLGSKQIALVASSYSVPVLVCCETYKFCERVLTDSFVHNELGEPEDISTSTLVSNDSLKNWQDMPSLQLLNLLYDVTPPDLISMVITEKGVLPCTSVPVVLRVRYAGLHE